jgi:hypothetical protein
MRCESLIDERLLDEAIDRYVAWREECYLVEEAYERWTHSCGGDAARAFAQYQAALDREGQIAAVYCSLMARVVITSEPSCGPAREPIADDGPQRGLLSCMTGEHGLVCYALAWVFALGIPAVLTALIVAVAVGTGRM